MKKSALIQLYDRTMRNCLYYEKEGKKMALLNEIGCLRGIAYALEYHMWFNHYTDSQFIRLIEIQQEMKDEKSFII